MFLSSHMRREHGRRWNIYDDTHRKAGGCYPTAVALGESRTTIERDKSTGGVTDVCAPVSGRHSEVPPL